MFHAAHGEVRFADQGKDGTSHFGDLDNLHIVSPISMLGGSDSGDDRVAMADVIWAKNCGHDVDRRRRQLDRSVFTKG